MDTYQYELVKKLSFLRWAGTDGELKAAQIVAREAERLGGHAEIEEFSIPAWKVKRCSVRAVSPFEKEYEALPCSEAERNGHK